MKLGHIELLVKDPLQSKSFYEDVLGFELVHNQDDKFIWLQSGGIEILLRPGQNIEHTDYFYHSSTNMVLYVDDVEKAKTQLLQNGIELRGEDQKCPLFQDMDGNWFQLVNPNEN